MTGLLLAAGAGTRMGGPKALVGPLAASGLPLAQVAGWLHEAGCAKVVAVVGAAADDVRAAVRADLPERQWLRLTEAGDWAAGMGASLRAGLTTLESGSAAAALVTLVDLPDVRVPVFARVLGSADLTCAVLARAVYAGRPGHPVLIGRDWWPRAAEYAMGDQGARGLLRTTAHDRIECGDLASGQDADRPNAIAPSDHRRVPSP